MDSKTLKIVVIMLLALALLWLDSPARRFSECRGNDVPRYCVD